MIWCSRFYLTSFSLDFYFPFPRNGWIGVGFLIRLQFFYAFSGIFIFESVSFDDAPSSLI